MGVAIVITPALTLFALLGWGLPLNRVSCCAWIFSIGILVDDAIVVVGEHPPPWAGKGSPGSGAVDEVGADHTGDPDRHRGLLPMASSAA